MFEKPIGQARSEVDHPSVTAGDVSVSHASPEWLSDSISIAPKVRYNRRYKPEAGEAFTGIVIDRGEDEDVYTGETHRVVVVETADGVRHGVRILTDLRRLWWIPDTTPVYIRPLRKRPLGDDGKFAWEFELRVPTGTKVNAERGTE